MDISGIISQILEKRGVTEDKLVEFLSPPHPARVELKNIGVDEGEVEKTISLVKKHASDKLPIVIFGDYDADGVTATAVLWEMLHYSGIKTMPFIPHRQKHGYGLSQAGLDQAIKEHGPSLMIAVDSGVTAIEATRYAQQRGVKLVVVDHHQVTGEEHPADALVHSSLVAGSGLTWLLSSRLRKALGLGYDPERTLELAAIGTVADLVPLTGVNRSLVKHGLVNLRATKRLGIKALMEVAGISGQDLEAYHLGFQLGPRLNAVGRLAEATEALRLLCTRDSRQAVDLARVLNRINLKRQEMTDRMTEAAFVMASKQKQSAIVLDDESFHEGIIGLVASKLSRARWRPTVVIARGEGVSKASARSIPGFNIIEAIRELEDLLEDVGGHPMAAGFTIKNDQLSAFAERFVEVAERVLTPQMLTRKLEVDARVTFDQLTDRLADELMRLAPFGVGNPEPLLASAEVAVVDARVVGAEGKHLKLFLEQGGRRFPAIAFGQGRLVSKLQPGAGVNLAYHLKRNVWNDRAELQLRVKEIQVAD